MLSKVVLAEKLRKFSTHFDPKIIGGLAVAVLLFKPVSTLNTGTAGGEPMVAHPAWI
jgi:hypothetical protein